MHIQPKTEHDPVADLVMPDAYMLWSLLAAEEVIGKQELANVLRQAGLKQLIDNYPPDYMNTTRELNSGHYASLLAGLLNRAEPDSQGTLSRIGLLSAKYSIDRQSALFNLTALLALKVMPVPLQLKMGLENMQSGFRRLWHTFGQTLDLRMEDRGDKLAYNAAACPMCAGQQADGLMC